MDATIWAGTGKRQFGIRVGYKNRNACFERSWTYIVVEIDGERCHFKLTDGFWHDCPEFRDGREGHIRAWLTKHGLLDWPKGQPPRVVLEELGGYFFRLLKSLP